MCNKNECPVFLWLLFLRMFRAKQCTSLHLTCSSFPQNSPHTHLHIHFSSDFHSTRTSLNPTWSPNVKSPSTYLPPPRAPPKILIMQAAVSPLRWGPPGDSSTASDWGCATEPDSSAHAAEEKNANGSNQMKAEMRAWSVERRRALRGTPDRLSFRLRPGVHHRAYLLCLFEWVGSTGRPGLRPQLLACFPSKVPWSLRDEQREQAREVLVKMRDRRMWEAIHSPLFCSFIPSSDMRFPSSVSTSLSLTICLPRSQSSPQSRHRIRT